MCRQRATYSLAPTLPRPAQAPRARSRCCLLAPAATLYRLAGRSVPLPAVHSARERRLLSPPLAALGHRLRGSGALPEAGAKAVRRPAPPRPYAVRAPRMVCDRARGGGRVCERSSGSALVCVTRVRRGSLRRARPRVAAARGAEAESLSETETKAAMRLRQGLAHTAWAGVGRFEFRRSSGVISFPSWFTDDIPDHPSRIPDPRAIRY